MKRIEDYLERGLSAEDIAKELSDFCGEVQGIGCSKCKYNGTYCSYEFLLDEMPHDKTLCELFYEMFPNAPKSSDNIPKFCPTSIGWGRECEGGRDSYCIACWNRKCKDVIEGYEE